MDQPRGVRVRLDDDFLDLVLGHDLLDPLQVPRGFALSPRQAFMTQRSRLTRSTAIARRNALRCRLANRQDPPMPSGRCTVGYRAGPERAWLAAAIDGAPHAHRGERRRRLPGSAGRPGSRRRGGCCPDLCQRRAIPGPVEAVPSGISSTASSSWREDLGHRVTHARLSGVVQHGRLGQVGPGTLTRGVDVVPE